MPVELETERLILRMPCLDDAEGLLDFVGDEAVMRPIGSEPGGIEAAIEHVERWIARWDANGMGPFLVVHREVGDIIGRVGPLVWNAATWETASLADAGENAEIEPEKLGAEPSETVELFDGSPATIWVHPR